MADTITVRMCQCGKPVELYFDECCHNLTHAEEADAQDASFVPESEAARYRSALQRIASAESGVWGRIAREVLTKGE